MRRFEHIRLNPDVVLKKFDAVVSIGDDSPDSGRTKKNVLRLGARK
jgi:hypothetical protein